MDFNIKPEDEQKLREAAEYPHWRLYYDHENGVHPVEVHHSGYYGHFSKNRFVTAEIFATRGLALGAVDEAKVLPYACDTSGLPQMLLDRHVPLIRNEYPSWNYITAVCVTPPENEKIYGGREYEMPTDEELAMIASYHDEYVRYFYGDPQYGWMARMRQKHPFDVDGGANGRFLAKYAITDKAKERGYAGGWGIRRRTWEHGLRPSPFKADEQMTLLEVLDHDHTIGDEPMQHWIDWKNDHPEIFGAKSDA